MCGYVVSSGFTGILPAGRDDNSARNQLDEMRTNRDEPIPYEVMILSQGNRGKWIDPVNQIKP
jgi:hypothetical protein